MALTKEERTERARRAAQARWADKTPEELRESEIKRVASLARNLGYRLVPLTED